MKHKILNFTTKRMGTQTKEGKISRCPQCQQKGALEENARFDIYTHSQEYSDSKYFRTIYKSNVCRVEASKERLELHYQMVLLVGGDEPKRSVSHVYWDIWKSAKDNPTRLKNYFTMLNDNDRERIATLGNKISARAKIYYSFETEERG